MVKLMVKLIKRESATADWVFRTSWSPDDEKCQWCFMVRTGDLPVGHLNIVSRCFQEWGKLWKAYVGFGMFPNSSTYCISFSGFSSILDRLLFQMHCLQHEGAHS